MDVTIIGETMRIKGTMASREEVHLNGDWEGEMEVGGRLIIGPSGKANAKINAERLVLRMGASLEGSVRTGAILIEDGAQFKGGIDIVRPSSS